MGEREARVENQASKIALIGLKKLKSPKSLVFFSFGCKINGEELSKSLFSEVKVERVLGGLLCGT
jgi:hypothetical protein